MNHDSLLRAVTNARQAYRDGFPITASVYMRHALSAANGLKDARLRGRVLSILNKIRPAARRAETVLITSIWS